MAHVAPHVMSEPRVEQRAILSPDAALCLDDGQNSSPGRPVLYFFKNRQFACWDVVDDVMLPGYPRDTESAWPGLISVFPNSGLRGALHVPEWGPKIHFLFRGQDKMAVWDPARGQLDTDLLPASRLLPSPFPIGDVIPVVARLRDGQRVVYGFHGLEYVRWTVATTLPTAPDPGFPRKIAEDWKDGLVLAPRTGVYVDWPNRSSAHSNKKIYFFMGDLYLRWDVPSNTRNYRLDILAGWKGWPTFA